MKPLKCFDEAFYPYVVQGGFGTVSAVAVGSYTVEPRFTSPHFKSFHS